MFIKSPFSSQCKKTFDGHQLYFHNQKIIYSGSLRFRHKGFFKFFMPWVKHDQVLSMFQSPTHCLLTCESKKTFMPEPKLLIDSDGIDFSILSVEINQNLNLSFRSSHSLCCATGHLLLALLYLIFSSLRNPNHNSKITKL